MHELQIFIDNTKSIRNFLFQLVLAGFLTLLLFDEFGLYSLFLPGSFLLIEFGRRIVIRVVRWAFYDDIDILTNYPATNQEGGFRSVVCPKCRGIRVYNGLTREPEHDIDSCMCDS